MSTQDAGAGGGPGPVRSDPYAPAPGGRPPGAAGYAGAETSSRWTAGSRPPEQRPTGESAGPADLAEEAAESARRVATHGARGARSLISDRKERVAGQISGIVEALQSAARQLDAQNQDWAAAYADRAAERLSSLADGLRQREIRDLLDDASMLARRRPAVVLAGAAIAGFLLARYLKASTAETSRTRTSGTYAESGSRYGGTGYGEAGRSYGQTGTPSAGTGSTYGEPSAPYGGTGGTTVGGGAP